MCYVNGEVFFMKYCVDYLIFLFIDFFCKRVCGKGDNVKFKI